MGGGALGQSLGGYGATRAGASDVDGAAMSDRDEPRLDVGVGGQIGVGAQRRQERLGPGVLGVDGADDGAADPQHRRAVLGHHVLERLHLHILKTLGPPRM